MAFATAMLNIAAGSLTTLSPCVLPVLPLVLGGAMQRNRLAPLAMGAGMVSAFTAIGVLAGALGSELDIGASDTRTFGAVLLLAFGLSMLIKKLDDLFKGALARIANRANAAASHMDGEGLWRAVLFGGLLGFIWSPCSGPLLGAALTLAATEGKAVEGAIRLGLFGLGAATPLVAVAYASRASLTRSRDAVLRYSDKARVLTGAGMVTLSLAILNGTDKRVEALLTSLLPDVWLNFVTRY